MKIDEYQGKDLLARYAVPVPRGEVARAVDETEAAAKKIGGSVVVKGQITPAIFPPSARPPRSGGKPS